MSQTSHFPFFYDDVCLWKSDLKDCTERNNNNNNDDDDDDDDDNNNNNNNNN